MNISLEWLADFLPEPPSAEQAADALTNGGLPVEKFTTVGPDTVIDVEVTSNRSDCLSHVGVARELAALLNFNFQELAIEAAGPASTDPTQSGLLALGIDAPTLCPHYTARVIRHVTVKPSPEWMQRRLRAVGLRPINNIVDVTNYVLFEMGQPLHAFDLDQLAGPQINVRLARTGETLVSLDGKKRALSPDMLVIADKTNPVALAGVMGGEATQVTAKTVNILLESARFDPLSVRATARALSMGSDSSYRFERGIDLTLPERASRRAVELILQTAGGELAGPRLIAGASGYSPKNLWLRLGRLQQVLGIELPAHQVVDALARLGLSPQLRGERIDVVVPSHRLDINFEIDLIEEVIRVVGYDKVPVREEISLRVAPVDLKLRTIDSIRSTMVAGGYFEALTLGFVSDALAKAFLPATAAGLPRTDSRVRGVDAQLRPSIVPGLLEAIRRNESVGTTDARLFEIGSTFWVDAQSKVVEKRQLALVGGTDYQQVRGLLETVLARLDQHKRVSVTAAEHPGYASNASGSISWGEQVVGHIGKISRELSDQLSLREPVIVAELDIASLIGGAVHVPQLHPLPRFPAIRRDLSLVVGEAVRYEQLRSLIDELKPDQLEGIDYVTTYRGKPLPPASKSITITLMFRSPETTLTSEAVETSVQKVIEAARERLNAVVRV